MKYVRSYPLTTRTGPTKVAAEVKTFLARKLPPLRVHLRHFLYDGGSELIDVRVRGLQREHGISTSHTPSDTPEMNSLLERKVRKIKQRVTCMLLHSTLPLPFLRKRPPFDYSCMLQPTQFLVMLHHSNVCMVVPPT
jgi:hypothetical protein